MAINRVQLEEILRSAENYVCLLGIVAINANWEKIAKIWSDKLSHNPDFKVTILCESDNILFSKSFLHDTDMLQDRRSFPELKFIRDRAIIDFPVFLKNEGVNEKQIGTGRKVELEIIHLPVPISIAKIDGKIFTNLWLHVIEDSFEEITQEHPWFPAFQAYLDAYIDPKLGRKYAAGEKEELLELFDHNRIPRGIYPRSCFYDTDYSQLVVWAFVFNREGRLLIHRRKDNAKDNQGMWDKSVGGHVDLAKDVETSRAVMRELVEELFSDEIKESKSKFRKWAVTYEDIVYLGEWRPEKRRMQPFKEIRMFNSEWTFFRLKDSQHLYSPRKLPKEEKGQLADDEQEERQAEKERRLRVISDVFLFVAGPDLTDDSLLRLKNSDYKLVELNELKNAMDKAMRDEAVPGFDKTNSKPKFTPDLTNTMTGELRDILEEFAQNIKKYINSEV